MSFSEEKRKKLIVPAVALMMCAVAMIGIGYATVNSSVSNDGNHIGEEFKSIGIYKNQEATTEATDPIFSSTCALNYATQKYNENDNGTWKLNTKYIFDTTAITVSDGSTYLKGEKLKNNNPDGESITTTCELCLTGSDVINSVVVTLTPTSSGNDVIFTFDNVVSGSKTVEGTIKNGMTYTVTITVTPDAEFVGEYTTPVFKFKFTI